jgi:hypothetical protein
LEAAADLARHYVTCGRPLTAANMQWDLVIQWHSEYWESLREHLKDKHLHFPKLTKALPIMKWAEAFDHYLKRVHGACSSL